MGNDIKLGIFLIVFFSFILTGLEQTKADEPNYLEAIKNIESPCAIPITKGGMVELLEVSQVQSNTVVTVVCPKQIVAFSYPYEKFKIVR